MTPDQARAFARAMKITIGFAGVLASADEENRESLLKTAVELADDFRDGKADPMKLAKLWDRCFCRGLGPDAEGPDHDPGCVLYSPEV
jgi:hypothetical protein